MKRRLLQIGAASLLAVAAALAVAPAARAVCAYSFSPVNGTRLECPSLGNFSVLVFNLPGAHVRDSVQTSGGTANLRVECTATGQPMPVNQTYVAFSGVAEGVRDFTCSASSTQVSMIRCGDTANCR